MSMDFDWAVPWGFNDAIDFAFLAFATIVVVAVPTVYGIKANLHDPMARSVLAGTGATALAFLTTCVFTVAIHLGWTPDDTTAHWIARLLYLAVAFGKASLLLSILRVLRASARRGSR